MNKILLDIPETIETPRLILQMPKAGFGEKLHEAILDGYEDYVKWLCWPATPTTSKEIEEECRKDNAAFILRNYISYIIIDKKTNKVLGQCVFSPDKTEWSITQFGVFYFIRKSERTKGYATESAYALAFLAFRLLKARKVEIGCDAENISSTRIPLKLGFKLEYTQKGIIPRYDNNLAEFQTYSIFSENDLLIKLEIKI